MATGCGLGQPPDVQTSPHPPEAQVHYLPPQRLPCGQELRLGRVGGERCCSRFEVGGHGRGWGRRLDVWPNAAPQVRGAPALCTAFSEIHTVRQGCVEGVACQTSSFQAPTCAPTTTAISNPAHPCYVRFLLMVMYHPCRASITARLAPLVCCTHLHAGRRRCTLGGTCGGPPGSWPQSTTDPQGWTACRHQGHHD